MSDNQRPAEPREARERDQANSGDSRDRSSQGGGSRFGGPQGQRGGDRNEGSGGRRPFGGGGGGGARRSGGGGGGRFGSRRKVCQFCVDNIVHVDYKDIARLRRHVGERGKIEPRRKLGTCARHQRSATVAIKRARYIGLLPFTTSAGRG